MPAFLPPTFLAPAGLAMLAGAGLLVLVGVVSVVRPALRVRRRAAALRATVATTRLDVERALALLVARRAETEALVQPWRRLLRLARHPLVVASSEWYRRRRRRAGPSRGGAASPSGPGHR